MRQIKFRAWDGEEMHYEDNMMLSFEGMLRLRVGEKNPSKCQRLCDGMYELMQFTGLKDKNGKEIYEGDIISDEWFNWIISFKNGSFIGTCQDGDFKREIQLFDNHHLKDKIVGNIYDNPELLEKK